MESPRPCLCSVLWSAPKKAFARAVRFALLPAASPWCSLSLVPIWGAWLRPLEGTARDGQKKPPHKQRDAKNRRFFDGLGEALLGVENHRSRHSRFGGIPKGSPFGASFSILSVRAESMAAGGTSSQSPLCLGLPSGALGPLPCSSFPQQTHFVGLCRGPHFPLRSGKNPPEGPPSTKKE